MYVEDASTDHVIFAIVFGQPPLDVFRNLRLLVLEAVTGAVEQLADVEERLDLHRAHHVGQVGRVDAFVEHALDRGRHRIIRTRPLFLPSVVIVDGANQQLGPDLAPIVLYDPIARTVTLAPPNPAFLLYAASGPWLPVHPATVATHGRTWTQPAHHIGNGPFTLAEWRQNQRIVVKKNPAYRAAADIRVDEIHFLRFDSGDTEERAYRAGQVDVTMSVPVTKIATYARERPAELQRTPLAETRYLAFNTTRPPLDDPAFRRALSDAIDREKIVDRVLLGGQTAARSFIPPALAPSPVVPTESAPKLFPNVGTIRLELTGWSQTPVLEAIQAMWREKLGLNVTIALRDAKVHVAALRAGAYDIGFITEIPDVADPALVLAQFTTGAPGNYPHWSDARYDAAPSEALLLASAPVAPLYFNTKNWLKSPRVQGWREDPFWTRDYTAVHLAAP